LKSASAVGLLNLPFEIKFTGTKKSVNADPCGSFPRDSDFARNRHPLDVAGLFRDIDGAGWQ
jgi:hypothetical protein